jgi:drug/metabolite transporter (DMT)-like permease
VSAVARAPAHASRRNDRTAAVALVAGATVWGLIWYPYRALAEAGVSGAAAATATYLIAFVLTAPFVRGWPRAPAVVGALAVLAVVTGWSNIGFTLGVIYGDVVRVVLLFYLSPLWTMVFARILLHERLTARGYGVVALALAGAGVMLWNPAVGAPLPRDAAEWMGLTAGVMFAASNVLSRHMGQVNGGVRACAIFAGCIAVGLAAMACVPAAVAVPPLPAVVLLGLLGIVIAAVNMAVQFGLAHVPANRAVVLYLFELVVTAASAWWLVGDRMTLQEWIGGGLIVAAGLASDLTRPPAAAA